MHKLKLQGKLKPIPFGCAVSLWVEFCCNYSKLGEDLMDDVFEFFQSLRANLWDVIYHHHRVDAISLLRLLPEDVLQEFWRKKKETLNLSHLLTAPLG